MRRLIILATLVSCSLNAGQIHKWIDEEGNVHYGDAPPNTVTTEPVRVIGAPSDPGKPLPRLSTGESPTKTSSNNRSGEEVPADQAKLACDQAKGDLEIISNSARIKLKSADGTSRYMTTEEIEARRENAEKDVARFCN